MSAVWKYFKWRDVNGGQAKCAIGKCSKTYIVKKGGGTSTLK